MSKIFQCKKLYDKQITRTIFETVIVPSGKSNSKCSISSTSFKNATSPEALLHDIRPVSDIPGPLNIPWLGGSTLPVLFSRDYNPKKNHLFWNKMVAQYGPIVKLKFVFKPWMVAVTEPDDIEAVFRATVDNPDRASLFSLKKVRYEAMDNFFGGKAGVFVENGEEWWRVRSRVQTPMMKPKNIVKYIHQMDDVSLDFMERIAFFQKEFGEMPSNFQVELYKWALENVSLITLNRRLGCLASDLPQDSTQVKLIDSVNILFEYLNEAEMNFPWWRWFKTDMYKNLEANHTAFFKIIDTYMSEAEKEIKEKAGTTADNEADKTLLQILLETEGLSRKDVFTFMLDLYFAGIDTTSHTLGFTMYLLSRNPEAQKKLQEEVDSVLGDGRQPINDSHLARLTFLKGCIKESQRLFPIVLGTIRGLDNDLVIRGYKIPKGYQMLLMTSIPTKNEKYFLRANEFLPERWNRSKPLGDIHPYASLPFSHGTRMCVGRRFAEQEMYIFFARLMHRFTVDYKYNDMDFYTRLVSVPTEPLRFNFTERR